MEVWKQCGVEKGEGATNRRRPIIQRLGLTRLPWLMTTVKSTRDLWRVLSYIKDNEHCMCLIFYIA